MSESAVPEASSVHLRAEERATRTMRKGTRSCVECRRRKIRCIFPPNNAQICSRCSSRGLKCIDQRHAGPEQTEDEKKTLRDRVARLEALLEATTVWDANPKEVGDTSKEEHDSDNSFSESDDLNEDYHTGVEAPLKSLLDPNPGLTPYMTPSVISSPHSPHTSVITPGDDIRAAKGENNPRREARLFNRRKRTCARLLAKLPPQERLLQYLHACGRTAWWKSWREKTFGPSEGTETLTQFALRTYSSQDPLDVALLVAAYGRTIENNAQVYLKAVDRLVIQKDDFACTIKGLECIMLQAKCHLDFAQPRRAWVMYRRGLTLAQLSGLHRNYAQSPKHAAIWWSLYHGDRFCSLLLGLPHSTHDLPKSDETCVFTGTTDSATTVHHLMQESGRIAGQVILLHQGSAPPQLSTVLHLDEQLELLALSVPSSWWDTTLPTENINRDEAESELRSRVLIHAYFLHIRMYLHLSSLIGSPSSTRFLHSRRLCIDAARTLLRRCTLLRSGSDASVSFTVDPLFDCKTNDFVGFTAAVVLLIGISNGTEQDHMKQQEDWASLYATRSLFSTLATRNNSRLAKQCYDALNTLIQATEGSSEPSITSPVKVFIPYFGKVCVRQRPDSLSSYTTPASLGSSHSIPNATHSYQFDDFSFDLATGIAADGTADWTLPQDSLAFSGTEFALEDPGVMFNGLGTTHGTGYQQATDNMAFDWLNDQIMDVDIDGDWNLFP